MCRPLSGFTTESTLVLEAWQYTQSHENLADIIGCTRDPLRRVQWECYPPGGEWDCPEKYALHTDQDMLPAWWDEAKASDVLAEILTRVERMIRRDKCAILSGGLWILADGFEAKRTIDACVFVGKGARVCLGDVHGTLTAGDVYSGGTLTAGDVYSGGTLTAGYVYSGGTLKAGNVYSGGTLTAGNVYSGGTLKAGNVYSGGTLTAGNVAGALTARDVYSGGTLTAGNVTGTLTAGYVYSGGTLTARDVYSGGTLTAGDVYSGGTLTARNVTGTGKKDIGGVLTLGPDCKVFA